MALEKPFFSIVIPVYNRQDFIGKTIESVLAQSFTNWQLIVVDDGSSDNTGNIVKSFADRRIHYIYQQNSERSASRNNAVQWAQANFICFLDSDDRYLPNHLAHLHAAIALNNGKIALYHTGILHEYIENKQQVLRKISLPKQVYSNSVARILDQTIFPSSTCLHKMILNKYQFDTTLSNWEDTELWLRIATEFPLVEVESYEVVWCIHENSTTQKFEKSFTIGHIREHVAVKKRTLDLPAVKKLLPSKVRKTFLAKQYYFYFFDSYNIDNKVFMFYFWVKRLIQMPSQLLTKETWSMIKWFFK